ncbi:GHKL domain-containing protein [bacterium]|nr:GHKL domain-containing protein [bacterium]
MLIILVISFLLGVLLGFFLFRRRKILVKYGGEDISELARSLAHEIRNPLNTIRMNLQLIQEELGDDERYKKRLARMEDELLRLDGILKTFLDYSRLPTPKFKKIDLNAEIIRIVDIVRARSENIDIEVHLADNLPKIKADPDMVAEVMHNILKNAIDASPEGGIIHIETARIKGGVSIAVSDKGTGIPPEMLDKIFKPYFSTKRGGVGIGMAVVKKIVELHSGKIRVQSRVGSGTRIIIELPIM